MCGPYPRADGKVQCCCKGDHCNERAPQSAMDAIGRTLVSKSSARITLISLAISLALAALF